MIHIGDNTHHQDQVIFPSSFKVMNAIVRSPVKPILFDGELLFAITFVIIDFAIAITALYVAFDDTL